MLGRFSSGFFKRESSWKELFGAGGARKPNPPPPSRVPTLRVVVHVQPVHVLHGPPDPRLVPRSKHPRAAWVPRVPVAGRLVTRAERLVVIVAGGWAGSGFSVGHSSFRSGAGAA